MSFYKILRKAIEFLIPTTCVGCGELGINLCENCRIGIKFNDFQVCPNCRAKSSYGDFCSGDCRDEIFSHSECFLNGIFVCCKYEKNGIIEKLITRFKYKFSDEIKEVLCPLITEFVKKFEDLNFNFIVPVPLHSKREKMRGFNQSEILANGIKSLEKLNILKRKYNTFPQAKLDRKGRLVNLTNAFELKNLNADDFQKFCNKNFLIIDDVCTTGSTLNECARALQPLHPNKIYGLVLARG